MKTEFSYQVGDEIKTVVVQREGDCFQVTIGDATYQIRAQRPEHGRLNLQVGDRRLRAHVASDGLRRYVGMAGQTWTLERPQPQQKRRGAAAGGPGAGSLEAAMPGLVLDVLVAEGDEVTQGQPLVLLSAMKMELRIAAPAAGRVLKIHCQAGQVVERGQVLVEMIEP
ncbi:MAG: biotin/lipoyl-containing protein [Anaerolineae bacterium]